MSGVETLEFGSNQSLSDMLATIPADQLDEAEVEGGLTWRQAAILGLTAGYLRTPGDDDVAQPFDTRLSVRLAVDEAFRARVTECGQPESARAAVTFCLEAAAFTYNQVCVTDPQWGNDRQLVLDLLTLWRDRDEPYITEELAGNVLWYMYRRTPS